MATIPASTTTFLASVVNSLSQSSILNNVPGGLPAAPINFIRTQDLANSLRLLQACLNSVSTLTATGGSTTTVVCAAATFVANKMVGYTITFAANTTTTALQNVSAVVISNTTTTLTVATLPGTVVTGDTFTFVANTITAGINSMVGVGVNGGITHNIALGQAVESGNDYPKMRAVQDLFVKLNFMVSGTVPNRLMFSTTALAGTSVTAIKIDTLGTKLRIDEFAGMQVLYNGTTRARIIGNTTDTLVLDTAVTAPAGGEAIAIGWYADDIGPQATRKVFSGSQSGENYVLADLITKTLAAVTAWTVPS